MPSRALAASGQSGSRRFGSQEIRQPACFATSIACRVALREGSLIRLIEP